MFSVGTEDSQLTAQTATVGYRGFSIPNITFTIASGTIFGLLGRSGSGKSTLINALVGLSSPQKGSFHLTVGGVEKPLATALGYSPQANALYPFLTVEENIRTFAQLYNVPATQAEERMTALLTRLDLVHSRAKRVEELSGGMEKRVDLAVTLIHDPAVIVLDEPFNGLDISLQRFIWELLQELAGKGRIIIITSHMLDDVQRYCTKFGLIENQRFYSDEEVRAALSKRQTSLQTFLQDLFREDLLRDENNSKS